MKKFFAPLFVLTSFCTLPAIAETQLGKPLSLTSATPIADILSSPASYDGKQVQVKGKVTGVCQMMGCWMAITDTASGKMIRIKVVDGEITFPGESVGRNAVAEGKLTKIELSREDVVARAKQAAEQRKQKFDASKITSGETIWQIAGTGAVIADE
ncbi:MAG: DUF4920 domain-containing protein [Acidobacteria bacterium]|nr:DUF4920 domain-containing protein [Acidobacteriota bacterium]